MKKIMERMNNVKFISIDFQNDFLSKKGLEYKPRHSVDFIKKTLLPFFRKYNIKIAEIISDYRQPRPGDTGDCCCPGEWGFLSGIPDDVKNQNIWIKSMNSPIWTRNNCGLADKKPGIPFQDTDGFGKWLKKTIGNYEEVDEVILIGLTIDSCVFSVAQELCWRGYNVSVLEEAVDTYSGNQKEKKQILDNRPLTNWTKAISWRKCLEKLNKCV